MKQYFWGLALIFLIACAQEAPKPIYAPPSQVVMAGCESTQEIGEKCSQNCECLRPGDCLNGICSLTQLETGKPCVDNTQCLSGYCTQTHVCGGPDGPKVNYDCERNCKDNYDGTPGECYTLCKYR